MYWNGKGNNSMSARTILSVLAFALLLSSGCGGGNNGSDEGRATLRGVVVDGNPYVDSSDLGGVCLLGNNVCKYANPQPASVANAEVTLYPYEEGKIGTFTVRTDSEGRFVVTVPPGSYRVLSPLSKQKQDAGDYCVSGGLVELKSDDDKSMVIGSDLCRKFTFIFE